VAGRPPAAAVVDADGANADAPAAVGAVSRAKAAIKRHVRAGASPPTGVDGGSDARTVMVSLVAACPPRFDPQRFKDALASWARVDGVGDVVVVLWGAEPGEVDAAAQKAASEHAGRGSRGNAFTLVRVLNQTRWSPAAAFNVGFREARSPVGVLKVDCGSVVRATAVAELRSERGPPKSLAGMLHEAYFSDGAECLGEVSSAPPATSTGAGEAEDPNAVGADEEYACDVGQPLLLGRAALNALGGYDERLAYWHEADVRARLRRLGFARRAMRPLDEARSAAPAYPPRRSRAAHEVPWAEALRERRAVAIELGGAGLRDASAPGPTSKTTAPRTPVVATTYDVVSLDAIVARTSPLRITAWRASTQLRGAHDAEKRSAYYDYLRRFRLTPYVLDAFLGDALYALALQMHRRRGSRPRLLVVDPKNGLANRLRTAASALAYADAHGSSRVPVLVWEPDEHCSARWSELFQPLRGGVVTLDAWPHAWPFSAAEWRAADFDTYNTVYKELDAGVRAGLTFHTRNYVAPDPDRHVYVRSTMGFAWSVVALPHANEKLRWLFAPAAPLARKLDRVTRELAGGLRNRVGVHIRLRTLRADIAGVDPAKEYSPAHLAAHARRSSAAANVTTFAEAMSRAWEREKTAGFFVAVDSAATKAQLVSALGGRGVPADRVVGFQRGACDARSVDCVRTAVVDIAALSATRSFLGSAVSSFSEVACRLSQAPGFQAAMVGVGPAPDCFVRDPDGDGDAPPDPYAEEPSERSGASPMRGEGAATPLADSPSHSAAASGTATASQSQAASRGSAHAGNGGFGRRARGASGGGVRPE